MQEKRFIYATIDNRFDRPNLAAFQAGGIDGTPLEAVSYRDVTAVVSRIDAATFGSSGSGEITTQAQEERNSAHLLQYQQVNAFLFGQTSQGGMLPLKFGFTADNDEEVSSVLQRAYVQLRSYLDRLQGSMELVIQASWELPKILQDIAKNTPELAGAEPVQAGRLLFEASEDRKRKFIAAIQAKLMPLSKDCLDAPIKAESMIFNRSYLVDKVNEPLFDDAVDAVATEFEEFLTFRYIGPLPAYSFVNIELNQGNFAMLDTSRRLLQLPEKADWDTIKSAYRQMILTHHPDRNPNDPLAAQRTKELAAAFEIVKAYCQSLPEAGEPGQLREFSFAQEAVEQVFILDDKGAVLAR